MKSAIGIVVLIIVIMAVLIMVGVFYTEKTTVRLISELYRNQPLVGRRVDFDRFDTLPPPVARYFQSVLTKGQRLISRATFQQTGQLRTSIETEKWLGFIATQYVSPAAPGFVWSAKVTVLGPIYVRVLDSYDRGIGSGSVRILSAVPAGSDRDTPELNSGALHRYLAEAVWYPTALLPENGVQWTSLDEHRALATLQDKDVKVSLEFRFNDNNEVVGIYSPGRWGSFDGKYKQVAWEGRFEDYQVVQGMRVPTKGEVGWYKGNKLVSVWQGEVRKAEYEFVE